jgi:energy-coupling factor transporter transmembrane protein EcfT
MYPPGMPGPAQPVSDPGKSRTKAVWALVLAILPLCGISWIAAVVLAILVLIGPRDGQSRGRGMAWAAIAIVVLWIVAVVVAIVVGVLSIPADRDEDGNVTSRGEIFTTSLRTGDCIDEDLFAEDATDTAVTVTVVPCGEPHPAQVYASVDLDPGTYPGENAIFDEADTLCYDEFEAWVGTSYETSELEVFYYYPTAETWEQDDRAISCVVIAPEDVTASLQGSGR